MNKSNPPIWRATFNNKIGPVKEVRTLPPREVIKLFELDHDNIRRLNELETIRNPTNQEQEEKKIRKMLEKHYKKIMDNNN